MSEKTENMSVGTVTEALPNANFRILLDSGNEIIGHLSGKMRKFRIRVLVSDRVEVTMSSYGDTKGRITRRL